MSFFNNEDFSDLRRWYEYAPPYEHPPALWLADQPFLVGERYYFERFGMAGGVTQAGRPHVAARGHGLS